MKKALIGCVALLVMAVAAGSAKADHFVRGGCVARPPVVVRTYSPPVVYRSYGGRGGYPAYSHHDHYYAPVDNHHHHSHGGVAVGGSGFYVRFGF